jgi:hypothetical protein
MKTAPDTCYCIYKEVWKPGIPGPTNVFVRKIYFNRKDAQTHCDTLNSFVNPLYDWYEIEEFSLPDRFFDGLETE